MVEPTYQPRRSLIFTPGTRPEMFAKALKAGADIVCIDLEDAIAPTHKDEARAKTLAFFAERPATPGVEPIVRINSPRSADGLADLLAIIESEAPPPAVSAPDNFVVAPAPGVSAAPEAPEAGGGD